MVMTGALCEAMADSQHGMTKAPWFFVPRLQTAPWWACLNRRPVRCNVVDR